MKKLKGLLILLIGLLTFGLASCGEKNNSVYELNKDKIELNINETFTLELTKDGVVIIDDIIWTSSNNDIASIKSGLVTAKAKGEAIISAELDNKKLECIVVVLEKDNITLSTNEALIEVGGTIKLSLTNNGREITDGVIWKSKDLELASVENGLVKGLTVGEATITATYDSKVYLCRITIMEKFNAQGSYVAERVVEEMGGVKFTFDLVLNSDKSYTYSRRTAELEGDVFEGGVINSGTWEYSNGLLVLTNSKSRIQFVVKDQDTISSVGKIDTGRVDSELTFIRAK